MEFELGECFSPCETGSVLGVEVLRRVAGGARLQPAVQREPPGTQAQALDVAHRIRKQRVLVRTLIAGSQQLGSKRPQRRLARTNPK